MSELKLCSYCKSVPQANTWTLHGISETRYFCPNPDCPHSVRTVTLEQWNTRPIEDELNNRIAELEGEVDILKDQQREAKNILIDKKLQIDSLYEEGYKLQQRIAELEAENEKINYFFRRLRMFCIFAHWDNPDTEAEFYKVDEEIHEYLSEYKVCEE